MKLTFFGTSHGIPEPNRRCSSALIEAGGRRYILDMGSHAVEQLITRNIPLEAIQSIFITHMHGDHTNGLISFVDLCSWKFKEVDPFLYLPGDLEATKAAMAAWLRCNGVVMRSFQFCSVREGQIYDDGVLRVTAYQTQHTDQSYALLLEADGRRVLFTGDLKGPAVDFPMSALSEPLDLAICESAHFAATDYVPLFRDNSNLKRLCLTHYSEKYLASVVQTVELLPEIEVFRAQDGMELVI